MQHSATAGAVGAQSEKWYALSGQETFGTWIRPDQGRAIRRRKRLARLAPMSRGGQTTSI
jgi:hypothetical protein